MTDKTKYFNLLSEKYPSIASLSREIINLSAILNLPKGTEHFMSDIHGEFEAFCHILNNCSGVVREKVGLIYGDTLGKEEIEEICTLIYYPAEKLGLLKKSRGTDRLWYRRTLERMIEIAKALSSKYTRSKVRKAMPAEYSYIIDELLHAQRDEDDNQIRYHDKIYDTIIDVGADDFIISLASLIKRLAVDRLHIVGDIFDRGRSAEKIIDMLINHYSLDIEWGNHDILWMGAACGCEACIANVVRNCVKYNTVATLENGYGISLRSLALFAEGLYPGLSPMKAALKAITVIQFKLEGQAIMRNPDFKMENRLLLDKIDLEKGTVISEGREYGLNDTNFPTLDPESPYELSQGEAAVVDELKRAFTGSLRLKKHAEFLYDKGGMYKIHNGNLLYHGCVPLDENGGFKKITLFGDEHFGRAYLDMADNIARLTFYEKNKQQLGLDFMWFLWCSPLSPLCGRNIKTFERAFINDKSAHTEEKNPYYSFYYQKETCEMILSEFGLDPGTAHIVNGHTPVKTTKGELPIRAGGKLFVIDGGFCEDYHSTTGIAGYTLIYNSHGLRLKAHQPFESVEAALSENIDIHSSSEIVETENRRRMVSDTDAGEALKAKIKDLQELLKMYRSGEIVVKE